MKIMNKVISLLFILVLCFTLLPVFINKASAKAEETSSGAVVTEYIQHIYDEAGLLSTEDLASLEDMCIEYGEEAGIDFFVLTHNNSNAVDGDKYIENFVDRTDYDNSVILLVDMYHRDVVLQGYGLAETYLHSGRLDDIRYEITDYLTNANYAKAFKIFIEDSAAYMKDDSDLNYDHDYSYDQNGNYTGSYSPETQYNDTTPEDVLTNPIFQLVTSLIIGGIVVGVMVYNSGGKMTTGGQTYLDRNHSGLIGRRDNYIRTTVTRVRKPTQNNKPGGFNAGGFRGGMSIGGHSHSSSRGKF
ncbi:MAG: hypothetical protein K0S76_2950 [Herbinix sp.]|jgi:uncharacterized protein|nr:hypothetical protein [Herbinix sp.]